jgi:carboxyl-terminal processing protease
VALTLGSGCSAIRRFGVGTVPLPTPLPTPEPIYSETFEALWQAVNDRYVYADFGGVNWQGVRDEYLPRVQEVTGDEEFTGLMLAMVDELPEGAVRYETRAERIEAETSDLTSYQGIGAFVSFRAEPDPHVVLLATVPDSPAEQAGLQAHDSFLAVDGLAVRSDEGLNVVQRIRGPAGSEAVLTVRSPGGEVREVRVTREQLTATAQLKVERISDRGIARFLFPPAGYEGLESDFAENYETLTSEGLNGLILDLRVAGSGVGWPLDLLLALFEDGEAGEFYTRQEVTPLAVQGQDIQNSQSLPVAILVGPDTGGIPEIFTAMLQSSGRATIIGLPTRGNIEGTSESQMPDGSRAFIHTSSYRTPAGDEVGLTGLSPDIPVEDDWDAVTSTEDPVLEAAVEWLLEQK